MNVQCCRCGTILRKRPVDSLMRTAAFSLAALIFYIPANIFPILRMHMYGIYTENTIWDGCLNLIRHRQLTVAIIVFLASILVSLLKLLGPANQGHHEMNHSQDKKENHQYYEHNREEPAEPDKDEPDKKEKQRKDD